MHCRESAEVQLRKGNFTLKAKPGFLSQVKVERGKMKHSSNQGQKLVTFDSVYEEL